MPLPDREYAVVELEGGLAHVVVMDVLQRFLMSREGLHLVARLGTFEVLNDESHHDDVPCHWYLDDNGLQIAEASGLRLTIAKRIPGRDLPRNLAVVANRVPVPRPN